MGGRQRFVLKHGFFQETKLANSLKERKNGETKRADTLRSHMTALQLRCHQPLIYVSPVLESLTELYVLSSVEIGESE